MPANYRLSLATLVSLVLLPAVAHAAPPPEDPWGFERCDLQGWTADGAAFANQPIVGNTVAARRPGTSPGHIGRCWIGTYEGVNGDAPTGTLLSNAFTVTGSEINFLVGGGNDLQRLRVELMVRVAPGEQLAVPALLSLGARVTLPDGEYVVVRAVTGRNDETMTRQTFDVAVFAGRSARLRIVDQATGSWGHINADDFNFGAVGDLIVTDMEVSQAIQVPGNRIPLIGEKRTAVRVYVRGIADARGPWDAVTGTLSVRNVGGPGPGDRVLRPITGNASGTITVTPLAGDRNLISGSLNFLLDRDQTRVGERDLEVRVSSLTARPEQSTANNVMTRRVRFEPAVQQWVYGATYGTTSSDPRGNRPAPPFTDFTMHVDLTTNMFPLTGLVMVPAHPWNSPPSFDWAGGTVHVGEALRWAENTLARLPGGASRGLYVLMPDADCGCGIEYPSTGVMMGHNLRNDQGGWVMGHELAHFFGVGHVRDTTAMRDDHTNDGPYEDHPYAHASIGPNPGVRTHAGRPFEVVPATWAGGHTHDLQSYALPQWVSPHTYCRILEGVTRGALRCPTGAASASWRGGEAPSTLFGSIAPGQPWSMQAPPQQAGERAWLLVQGSIGAKSASFAPFEQILRREDPRGKISGKRYSLTLEDAQGGVLVRQSFEPTQRDGKPAALRPFSLIVPYDPATAKIVLRGDGKQLAERVVSAHAPQVGKLVLDAKKAATGPTVLAWEAKDDDGDPLVHSIEYSPDAGVRWYPLAVARREAKLTVDLQGLPGGDAAVIRVLSSDGVRTSEARTPAFAVARRAPGVRISPLAAGSVKVGEHSPVVLSGSAVDPEDGPIFATDALRWRSDRDGELGRGPWIVVRALSPGTHRIRLTASDSHQQSASAELVLTVEGAGK